MKKSNYFILLFLLLLAPCGASNSRDILNSPLTLDTPWCSEPTKGGGKESENTFGDEIKGDIKIKVASSKASSWQMRFDLTKSYDGDYGSVYHSNHNNRTANYFPISLTYDFKSEDIDYLIYYPRLYGLNGNLKEVEIYVKTAENTTFTKVMTKMFGGTNAPARVVFDTPLKSVTSVMLKVLSGSGDDAGFAVCSEMEFYQYRPDSFDPLTLFTDESCSELKSGIKRKDIRRCKNEFYAKLATGMFDDSYNTEFRVGSYKAWMNPDRQKAEVKNSFAYSLLDNATGMIAKKGEDLIVLVGETNGAALSIKVQNLDSPRGDGYNNNSSIYSLGEGQNRLKIRGDGLIYVMYHSDEPESEKPITIHFVTGEVNGYFDSQKHDKDDWKRLLSGAKDKHFDLLGEYAHLTFPTEVFKKVTLDGKSLIDIYDIIVKEEQKLIGLVEGETMFKNRMYCHVAYNGVFMQAGPYRVMFGAGIMEKLCDSDIVATEYLWVPAHEIGHANQTIPGMKWLPVTDVTNNILALHVQRVLGNKSRLDAENRYSDAHTSVAQKYKDPKGEIVGANRPYVMLSDDFNLLVPFWQLYLYFQQVDGDLSFYPKLQRKIRNNVRTPRGNGACQLQFVRFACEVSGYDLIEFFEYWGFLTPIKLRLNDSMLAILQMQVQMSMDPELHITQEQVDELKAEIRSKSYKTPKSDIWKITDSNCSDF